LRNWTSFWSAWARTWDGHDVIDLAVGGGTIACTLSKEPAISRVPVIR
jgi:hypothetical protein